MRKSILLGVILAAAAAATPASAQFDGRLAIEPYVGYGFFGSLPETDAELEADLAYGGRASFRLSPQWAVFGNFQRSTPELTGSVFGFELDGGEVNVDHWSAGIEFSYVPRGGAEGMLPILIEAGLGQARYGGGSSDLAVNLGIASALQLSPNLSIRFGGNDYISNFGDDNGVVNQIFVTVGPEVRF